MRVVRAFLALAGIAVAWVGGSPAQAAWSAWYSLGGAIIGEPSIVAYKSGSPGYVGVAGRGTDNALWYRYASANGIDFTPWTTLGGIITSSPSCVSRQSGIFDCFARSSNNTVAQRQYSNNNWVPWGDLGGTFNSGPGAIGSYEHSTGIFIISGAALYHRLWNSGAGWENQWELAQTGVPTGSSVECDQGPREGAANQLDFGIFYQSRVLCLLRAPNSDIYGYEFYFSGQGISQNQGGANASSTLVAETWFGQMPEIPDSAYRPDVVMTGPTTARVFVTATDGTLRTATWESGVAFGPWENLGGLLTSGPSCSDGNSNQFDFTIICAGRGGDGAVWAIRLLK